MGLTIFYFVFLFMDFRFLDAQILDVTLIDSYGDSTDLFYHNAVFNVECSCLNNTCRKITMTFPDGTDEVNNNPDNTSISHDVIISDWNNLGNYACTFEMENSTQIIHSYNLDYKLCPRDKRDKCLGSDYGLCTMVQRKNKSKSCDQIPTDMSNDLVCRNAMKNDSYVCVVGATSNYINGTLCKAVFHYFQNKSYGLPYVQFTYSELFCRLTSSSESTKRKALSLYFAKNAVAHQTCMQIPDADLVFVPMAAELYLNTSSTLLCTVCAGSVSIDYLLKYSGIIFPPTYIGCSFSTTIEYGNIRVNKFKSTSKVKLTINYHHAITNGTTSIYLISIDASTRMNLSYDSRADPALVNQRHLTCSFLTVPDDNFVPTLSILFNNQFVTNFAKSTLSSITILAQANGLYTCKSKIVYFAEFYTRENFTDEKENHLDLTSNLSSVAPPGVVSTMLINLAITVGGLLLVVIVGIITFLRFRYWKKRRALKKLLASTSSDILTFGITREKSMSLRNQKPVKSSVKSKSSKQMKFSKTSTKESKTELKNSKTSGHEPKKSKSSLSEKKHSSGK